MKKIFFLAGLVLALISCQEQDYGKSDLSRNALIPQAKEVISDSSFLKISEELLLVGDTSEIDVNTYYALLEQSWSLKDVELKLRLKKPKLKKGALHLMIDEQLSEQAEAYEITVTRNLIFLKGNSKEGLYRGMQTLIQLFELEGSDVHRDTTSLLIPTGIIRDHADYSYRGAMLDVARHFFSIEDVKKYIDRLAYYKINKLHLHLSDDQGWRIEIKSWPLLTEIGGSTEVGGGEGGYYTQEEYQEIVAYANSKFITIIPEIDLPGHTNAALASYAELNCDGKARELYTGTRVGFSTLCVRDELCYKFVDDVLGEIAALSPGPYIHIGGDESHSTAHDDYVYFIDRVKEIVNSHGKQMMGWDEISHGAIGEGDVAQFWSSKENSERALAKGAKVLMSPADYCYLDMKYDSSTVLGLTWAGYTDVEDAYNWNPLALLDGVKKDQILGIESPLWGETIETLDDIEYLTFPRIIGHAEIGWSGSEAMSMEEYMERLTFHKKNLTTHGVSYHAE